MWQSLLQRQVVSLWPKRECVCPCTLKGWSLIIYLYIYIYHIYIYIYRQHHACTNFDIYIIEGWNLKRERGCPCMHGALKGWSLVKAVHACCFEGQEPRYIHTRRQHHACTNLDEKSWSLIIIGSTMNKR